MAFPWMWDFLAKGLEQSFPLRLRHHMPNVLLKELCHRMWWVFAKIGCIWYIGYRNYGGSWMHAYGPWLAKGQKKS
jgi:hypothetical protein